MMLDKETILKAENAVDNALEHLNKGLEYLNKAYNWGIADIMGGLLIVSIAKHKKLSSAKAELDLARTHMNRLIKIMGSSRRSSEIRIPEKSFLTFSDIMIDNPISDIVAQNKIDECRTKVEETITKMELIQQKLHEQKLMYL